MTPKQPVIEFDEIEGRFVTYWTSDPKWCYVGYAATPLNKREWFVFHLCSNLLLKMNILLAIISALNLTFVLGANHRLEIMRDNESDDGLEELFEDEVID